jgi:hypothetical protein
MYKCTILSNKPKTFMINQLIDELIASYKSIRKRKQIMKREIEGFILRLLRTTKKTRLNICSIRR